MKNELKDICDKLEGYSNECPDWEVINAESYGEGDKKVWKLTIRAGRPEQEENNAD